MGATAIKGSNMKKSSFGGFAGMVVGLLCALSVEVNAVELTGDTHGELHYIYHDQQLVVIQDQAYRMALNLKVFDANGKLANRFALRPGLSLRYFAKYQAETREYIVTKIEILK